MPAQAILHPEFFAGLEVALVDLQATIKVIPMHALSPAIADLLG
jgi:hypothetical protein